MNVSRSEPESASEPYGPVQVTTSDPSSQTTAAIVLGVVGLLAGAIVFALMLAEPPKSSDDAIGVYVLLGLLVIGGIGSGAFGIRRKSARAGWAISESHLMRVMFGRVQRAYPLRDITQVFPPRAIRRYGRELFTQVVFVRCGAVKSTDPDAAVRIYNLWRAARERED